MAMPEKSDRTGDWVRPLFTVLWETGLRGATVLRLEAPLHYRKGARSLFVTREIDKEGFERHVPLSPEARRALDRACPPDGGKLFTSGASSFRKYLTPAVKAAGLTDRNISTYDLKHSRISIGANSGAPLAGIAHLVGHKHVSTTAIYVQTGEAAAVRALEVMASVPHQAARVPRNRAAGGRNGGRKAKKVEA
jgi:integrase